MIIRKIFNPFYSFFFPKYPVNFFIPFISISFSFYSSSFIYSCNPLSILQFITIANISNIKSSNWHFLFFTCLNNPSLFFSFLFFHLLYHSNNTKHFVQPPNLIKFYLSQIVFFNLLYIPFISPKSILLQLNK